MTKLIEVVHDRNAFEDYVYEQKEDSYVYTEKNRKMLTVHLIGGLFTYEVEEVDADVDGFEIGRHSIKHFCTIEKVRRELLKKEKEGLNLKELDRYEEDQLIAEIVVSATY